MRKSILAALLTTNLMAASAATVSPDELLIARCKAIPQLSLDGLLPLSPEHAANELESQLLPLFNINQQLDYFRLLVSNDKNNQLLQCQLHLADLLDNLLTASELSQLLDSLAQSSMPATRALGERLDNLRHNRMSPNDKAKLHTAQAAVKHALTNSQMHLEVPNQQCRITRNKPSGSIDSQIARYLLQQHNADCRAQVWQAFQKRSAGRTRQALDEIQHLRQSQAAANGWPDYASFRLKDDILSSPSLVMEFLNSQTHNIGVAPWDIGRQLKVLPKAAFESLTPYTLIALLTPAFEQLGLSYDKPQPQIYRFWYQGRLLGQVHLAQDNHLQAYTLEKPVTGRQFGTVLLMLPANIVSQRQLNRAVEQLADAIATLSFSQPYFLSDSKDGISDIGRRWLSLWLMSQLEQVLPHPKDSRLALATRYAKQLAVFRAKLALMLSRHAGQSSVSLQAPAWFEAGFGYPWANSAEAAFGFTALAQTGPEYYLPMWHQALADIIMKQTECCQSPAKVYQALLINEPLHTLPQVLTEQLHLPADPVTIIGRMKDNE
ncbi:MAG: M3 family metallopeptidase [Shewanella sp.]|nr:M3 family metallopeptidase [Shewanella sp.]MCF1458168.1 M3 family metallopeptidase [Shewanella sp.]